MKGLHLVANKKDELRRQYRSKEKREIFKKGEEIITCRQAILNEGDGWLILFRMSPTGSKPRSQSRIESERGR